MQHIFSEHSQEADQMANFRLKSVEKIAVYEKMNREWKARRGWWDGSVNKNMAEAV